MNQISFEVVISVESILINRQSLSEMQKITVVEN